MHIPIVRGHPAGAGVGHSRDPGKDVATREKSSILFWHQVLSLTAALLAAVVIIGAVPDAASASPDNRATFAEKCRASGGTYYEYEYVYDLGGGWIESGIAFGCKRSNGTIVHCDDEGVDNHGWMGGCNPDWKGPLPPASRLNGQPALTDEQQAVQEVSDPASPHAAPDANVAQPIFPTDAEISTGRIVAKTPANEPADTLAPNDAEPSVATIGGWHPQDTFERDCEARGGYVDKVSSPGQWVCVGPGPLPIGTCDPNWGGACGFNLSSPLGIGTSPLAVDESVLESGPAPGSGRPYELLNGDALTGEEPVLAGTDVGNPGGALVAADKENDEDA